MHVPVISLIQPGSQISALEALITPVRSLVESGAIGVEHEVIDVVERLVQWQCFYNKERGHSSLGERAP